MGVLQSRWTIGVRILQSLLSIHAPAPLHSLTDFKTKDPDVRRELENVEWQIKFLSTLVQKKALISSVIRVSPRQGEVYYKVVNRYLIQQLLDGEYNDSLREYFSVPPEAEMNPIVSSPTVPVPPARPVPSPPAPSAPSISSEKTQEDISLRKIYDMLVLQEQREVARSDLQVQIAETLIFVKDELISMRDKISDIRKRLKAADEQPPSLEVQDVLAKVLAEMTEKTKPILEAVFFLKDVANTPPVVTAPVPDPKYIISSLESLTKEMKQIRTHAADLLTRDESDG